MKRVTLQFFSAVGGLLGMLLVPVGLLVVLIIDLWAVLLIGGFVAYLVNSVYRSL